MMTANEIRKKFLTYFEAKNHRVVRSSSLVPANDPTLLFANAGMNQFKDLFLGAEKPASPRACSSQKCVRAGGKHNDLEQVGRTTRHHTFFEMLGNFSFGDYFKKEAIAFAWELVTSPAWLGIPKDKLYVTIFGGGELVFLVNLPEDEESRGFWEKAGVDRDRIVPIPGFKDNFWAMGDTGPCGPCSEIHYDMGAAATDQGHTDCKFPCDCGRYVELWNLVFMQFNRDEQGKLTPLPRPSIDTGAGLERLAAVLQGKLSNFDTDLFQPLIQEAAELAKVEYGANHETDVSLRIIADHARAATFLISDGVIPSNEGRGYVLRLIIRRALYHGQTLSLNEPFLFRMSRHVVDMMKGAYPELAETTHHIAKAMKIEEERYAHTTRLGVEHLRDARVVTYIGEETSYWVWETYFPQFKMLLPGRLEEIKQQPAYSGMRFDKSNRNAPPRGTSWIPGDELFKLHDTFGLRPDFVEDIVKNYGLTIDRAGYETEMQKQRERARASWKGTAKKSALPIYQEIAERLKIAYDPYHYPKLDACQVIALVVDGRSVDQAIPAREPKLVEIVLDKTPFYAEGGGQVGDTGRLINFGTQEEIASVIDTFSPVSGLIVHKAVVRQTVRKGDFAIAVVDDTRRDAIRRNHTATHLLQAALRTTLGTHVKQAGSLVAPDRLRFDFTHYTALDEQDLLDIEDLVNEYVLKNENVVTTSTDLETAINSGAMALFGEKYGETVRVVCVGNGAYSKELCGGTHVSQTGQIGLVKITSESSVAVGTRRIEALTGMGALRDYEAKQRTLQSLAELLNVGDAHMLVKVNELAEKTAKIQKELDATKLRSALQQAGDPLELAKEVKGVRVLSTRVEVTDRAAMRQMVDNLRPRLNSGVIVLGSVLDGPSTSAQGGEQKSNRKVSLIVAVTKDLTDRLDAGRIIKEAVAIVGGKGGGRKDLAEAGGTQPEKLDEALGAIPSIIEKML